MLFDRNKKKQDKEFESKPIFATTNCQSTSMFLTDADGKNH